MITLTSQRLKLIALDVQLLSIWSNDGRAALEEKLGLNPSNMILEDPFASENKAALFDFWLPMTSKYPLYLGWFTNWEIINIAENVSIGGIGFSYFPDENGQTQLGYYISKTFINQGFATEAVNVVVGWAAKESALKCINADTFHDNIPSQKVLMANGFIKTGSSISPKNEDGASLIKWQKCFNF